MKTFKQFLQVKEEGPVAVNSAGSGSYAGIGVGAQGEPGGRKAIMNRMIRRKKPNVGSKVSS
jgi:hypothetical protein